MINDNKIRGLNTAATMLCVAVIGVLTGLKLIFGAVSGTIAIIFTNLFIRKVKKTIKISRHIDDDL